MAKLAPSKRCYIMNVQLVSFRPLMLLSAPPPKEVSRGTILAINCTYFHIKSLETCVRHVGAGTCCGWQFATTTGIRIWSRQSSGNPAHEWWYNVNHRNWKANTPLFSAAKYGYKKVVQSLRVKKGICADISNVTHESHLFVAVYNRHASGPITDRQKGCECQYQDVVWIYANLGSGPQKGSRWWSSYSLCQALNWHSNGRRQQVTAGTTWWSHG